MRKFVLPLLFVFCCLFLLFSVAQARSQNSTTQKPQFTQQKRELSNSFPERISGHQSQNSHIVVHPDTLDFDTTMTGYSVIRELHIRNAGTTDLMVSDIQSTDYVFTVDTTHFSLPPADSLVLPVTFLPFIMGDYNGELLIISNDPAPQRDTVRVFMRGSGYSPPIIHPPLYPLSIEETVPEG
ncbi:MAG: hypothetical protein GWN30_35945, partial [Gammaproteobacteria bacterium]|nr:hypothetical protein [Gammaproteobacteria bacterium]NIW99390.1 hypothetical protein [Phycisphaerae bacterium]